MELLNIKEFEELLLLQTGTPNNVEEIPPSQENILQKYIEVKSYEELKKATEKCYNPDDLPEDYFFSALGELVLM